MRGSLGELSDTVSERVLKGEIVLVVDRPGSVAVDEADIESALRVALREMSVKQAAAEVAEAFGVKKRDVYQMALELKGRDA